MRSKYLVAILVLLALAAPASTAHAGGIVSVCDEAHLRAALAGGGTVTFSCSGTITLAAQILITADTTIDGSGQTVTISGNHAVRVFYVDYRIPVITFNLNMITIADGYRPTSSGGGIFNDSGTVTVSNSTFVGNSPDASGGGIFNYYGTVNVSNSTFTSNAAGALSGGGIFNQHGTLNVSRSTFAGNSAGSSAGTGGAIYNNYGTLSVSNSTFAGNSAAADGGAIYNWYSTLTVSNSTFSGNSSGFEGGGAIYNGYDAPVVVSNSTFSGNSGNFGGGILSFGPVTVSNSTFSGNSASSSNAGGGIHTFDGSVTLKNTIVANSPLGNNCFGTIIDGGGNLSYPDTTCPGTNGNPLLGSLQNNGGPTQTMALGSGSAALDAGNDAICAAAPVNNHDQRGIGRPRGPHCDIGAVEEYCPSFVPPASVGVEDILAIVERWGWTNSTPGWDAAYDLNGDNKIDIVDIMLVTAAWGRTCS